MGKAETEEGEQLVLEDLKKEKKPKTEDEAKAKPESKRWVVIILLLSVIVSLVFYLTSGKRGVANKALDAEPEPASTEAPASRGGGLFGPKVYEY